jgi:mRNA interferase MazF
MEGFVKGDVVVIPFPFSDLSENKRRPALVVAELDNDEIILCQITSRARIDKYSVLLDQQDFKQGGLKVESIIRPNKLFTAERSIVSYKGGSLKEIKVKQIEKELIKIFSG